MYTGEGSGAIMKMIVGEFLRRNQVVIAEVEGVYFYDFDFAMLPESNLVEPFVGINHCGFVNCTNLESLERVARYLPNLQTLSCEGCPLLTTIASLGSISHGAPLRYLSFDTCGICTPSNDEWDLALEKIENLHELYITNCDSLTALPYSLLEHLPECKLHLQGCSPELIQAFEYCGVSFIDGQQVQDLRDYFEQIRDA
mmetsp:Transcript_11369/g.16590  ORF Transcript_11369/g.16590 Transcript_11369/m.16590 type:complete len:199 (+) Transcript_11369:99-695(+)